MEASIRGALLDALALLFPVECVACGAPDRSICADCVSRLQPRLQHNRLGDGTPVLSALDYSGVARSVILAFKENGRTDVTSALAGPLRQALMAAAADCAAPLPELACVPTSAASYRRRGYDPVRMLLRRAGCTSSRVLRPVRGTAQQKALDREARRTNAVGSLAARRRLDGRRFIVVDDVMTTGATLEEACRAIREAGGSVAAAVTLAHTARVIATHSSK